jgi:hypothetical protein
LVSKNWTKIFTALQTNGGAVFFDAHLGVMTAIFLVALADFDPVILDFRAGKVSSQIFFGVGMYNPATGACFHNETNPFDM